MRVYYQATSTNVAHIARGLALAPLAARVKRTPWHGGKLSRCACTRSASYRAARGTRGINHLHIAAAATARHNVSVYHGLNSCRKWQRSESGGIGVSWRQ